MSYVAMIHAADQLSTAGPVAFETFETAGEAWDHLASEYARDSEASRFPCAYVPLDQADPTGPQARSAVLARLEDASQGIDSRGRVWPSATEGTIYGPTPGHEECAHDDPGVAYEVVWAEDADELRGRVR